MADSPDDDRDTWLRELKAALDRHAAQRRQHANFFDWLDKETKHLGIAQNFCEQLERQHGIAYSLAAASEIDPGAPLDPPDVVVKDASGALVGMEITELVNEAAITAQIEGRADYFAISYGFGVSAAMELLHAIVARKDLAAVNVRFKYSEYLLLIHCAEPWLSRDALANTIRSHAWPQRRGIDAAYLMFDYEPTDPYHIVRLF